MDRTIVIVGDIFLGGASAENAQSFLKDLDLDNSEALVCNLEQAISETEGDRMLRKGTLYTDGKEP